MSRDKKVLQTQGSPQKRGRMKEILRSFRRNKLAMLGLILLVLLIVGAIFADVIADYDDVVSKQDYSSRLESPSREHIFGTDDYGRDLFARVLHGTRISLWIGLISVSVALAAGGFIGSIAGFYGGKIDNAIMRTMDVLMAIPGTLLAIAIVSALGTGVTNLIIALAISRIPSYARIVRIEILSIRGQEFVEAAEAIGCKDRTIIGHHIIPNVIGPLTVQATLGIAQSILEAASLSYIGLGVRPPIPEWGSILSAGSEFIRYAPHYIFFPGLAIFLTVLSLNLLGDGLRDALDPRLKQ